MKTHQTSSRQSLLVLSASLLLLIATCFSATPTFAADDADAIQGTWNFVEGEVNGTSLGEILKRQGITKMQVQFSDDVMSMSGFGPRNQQWEFSLDETKNPKEVRLVAVETAGKAAKGTKLTAIYELEGDQLKLCLPGDETVGVPKDFKAPAESRLSSLMLKRQTDKEESPAKP
ncbi:TIGR03067 domain-containing protein [Blastopirellula retiformator]|uniref:TIGR03067 domain-containing protein n=1 Tax=Blastopirellula retiformator TaxID=2527970 RepID=A0A5C5UUN9_9BACT|nr:TIGR03067 domain-containing protein [Blastopirellula retiformator]TWT29838.1 hypothetical protein Enr8_44940 [Blastopirellula retiformator]